MFHSLLVGKSVLHLNARTSVISKDRALEEVVEQFGARIQTPQGL